MTQGNGHDPEDKDKIVPFRTLAEKDRARREKLKEEKIWQRQYKAENRNVPPMFNLGNIPPFAKFFTAAMLLINIPLFFLSGLKLQAVYTFGFIPAALTSGAPSAATFLTPFTHMLLHGDWTHLAFNAVMMIALGMFFEKSYGTKTAIIFFTLCGLAGALTFLAFDPASTTPMIGASGGISGFFAAFLMISPIGGRLGGSPWKLVVIWLVLMLVIGFISGANVAWQAHIGGYVLGAILARGLQTGRLKF